MEDLQTDTLCDYGKRAENTDLDATKDNESSCAANLHNGSEEIEELIDNCENASIGSNSDVWNGSDSEDEASGETSNLPLKESEGENEETQVEKMVDDEKTEKQVGDGTLVATKTSEDKDEDQEGPVLTESTAEKNENQEGATLTENSEKKNVDQEEASDSLEKDKNNESENVDQEASDLEKDKNNESENADQEEGSDLKKDKNNESENVDQEEASDDLEKDKNNESKAAKETETEKTVEGKNKVTRDVRGDSVEKDVECVVDKDPLEIPFAPETNNEEETYFNNETMDDDDDDDFDPSLLCPEVSMAVDDNPVITTNGPAPNDSQTATLMPYDPVFVDEVTGVEVSFNLNNEEQELRKRLYGPTNPVEITRIHCTACNMHLGSALSGQKNRYVHPLLKVLICKKCYNFYTSGEFEKDEDGSELYCRWCGQGGQVLCCSKCEFVFCKKCIRNNFGRKKMFEVRDSDSWECFRCNPSQIMTQRIAAYEFFEYIRRETSRAASLDDPELWGKDHSRCCCVKKKPENGEQESKKVKRKKNVDPDYNPFKDKKDDAGNPLSTVLVKSGDVLLTKQVHILPRPPQKKDNDIEFVRTIPAPQLVINPLNRPQTSVNLSSFRNIVPRTIGVAPVLQPPPMVRLPPTIQTTNNRILGRALQGNTSSSMMKHEWFEKTVRAAARVNSHLSYTLTQLNKAQSQASSVEELAVVHNKLQEIMSSSINSLIQIRKNLRTEFIAGIKTVKLPTRKVQESFVNDDDVIFVSAPTTTPSTSQAPPAPPQPTLIGEVLARPVSTLEKKPSDTARGPYLKVKSVFELQNVPSECITIPDDPPKKDLEKGRNSDAVCNGEDETVDVEKVESEGQKTEEDSTEKVVRRGRKKKGEVQDSSVPNGEDVKKEEESEGQEIKDENSSGKVARRGRKRKGEVQDSSEPNRQDEKKEEDKENTEDVEKVKSEEENSTEKPRRGRKRKVEDPSAPVLKKMRSVCVNLERVDLEALRKKLSEDKKDDSKETRKVEVNRLVKVDLEALKKRLSSGR